MSFRDVIRESKQQQQLNSSSSSNTTTTLPKINHNNNNTTLNSHSSTTRKQTKPVRSSKSSSTITTTSNNSNTFQQPPSKDFTVIQVYQNSDDDDMYSLGNDGGTGMGQHSFENTCLEIEKLLSEINSASSSIQKSTENILGTLKDTHEFRESLSLIIKKSSHQVETLSHHLVTLEKFKKEKQHLQKVKIDKLNSQAEQILNNYKKQTTLCLKKQKETLAQFKKNQSILQQQHYTRKSSSSEESDRTERDSLLMKPSLEDERLMNEIEFNSKILHEREKDILEVESSIREINSIFKELHYLTIKQGEDLDLIGDRVEETAQHVSRGKENLVVAEKRSKIGRNLLCILLLVILAIAATVAVVLVILKVVGVF
ncbi:hypothetical protein FDP41_013545 [Naegleria fowleri]|uniref:t-SNARE coiled-coil homology domain-containing protein n=1 Tax=Naegleria fowleri TaxID=5763 RepID=A0A6A5C0A4_NAEFO|nr:uncharacterized protein FDP41_013545 [Naegleria fowleri]KAF0980331.1 hypothetical protein FDP41_013545 [Naegleria fowleri]CAG4708208.1 unnamed protein product [Naegleria fowleri]